MASLALTPRGHLLFTAADGTFQPPVALLRRTPVKPKAPARRDGKQRLTPAKQRAISERMAQAPGCKEKPGEEAEGLQTVVTGRRFSRALSG